MHVMPVGLYLFCLARLDRLPPSPLTGTWLDGQTPLEVVRFRDLAAVWTPVPVEEFCGPEAEARLQDLAWIGPRVVRHQGVVNLVMRHSPVLPARFGTIFFSAANLEKILHLHYDVIAEFLTQVADHEEWAVKGLLNQAQAKDRLFSLKLAQEGDRLGALSPGKRYFEEQRLRSACNQELQQWIEEVCQEVGTDLRDYAAEVRQRRLLSRDATGSDQDMIVNWAFLVPSQAVPVFQARIQEANARFADRGLVFECTGPWPPYSFTPSLDLEAAA
jgi:hypothetical protein